MFTYLQRWFSMIYQIFFPKPVPEPTINLQRLRRSKPIIPRRWDPVTIDEMPIFTESRTIGTNYAPITDSLSYRRIRRDSNLRQSTPGYNNYSGDPIYSKIS